MITKGSGLTFFDLDGTITDKDTFLAFIRYAKGNLKFVLGLALLSPFVLAYYAGFYSNHQLKVRFFSFFFKGSLISEVQKQGDAFALNVLPQLCREGALKVLQKHQQYGHKIYIVTASSDIWTAAWCQQQGFQLIATAFEERAGQYTGKFDGKNCHGKEKYRRVAPIVDQYPDTTIYAYGDESSDRYFLSLAEFAYCMELSLENILEEGLLGE